MALRAGRFAALVAVLVLAVSARAGAWSSSDCIAEMGVWNSTSLAATVTFKYLNKAQSALAVSAIMRSNSPAGGAPGAALAGGVPLAFTPAAGGGACNFSGGAAVAEVTGKAGAVEVGTLNDTDYNITFGTITGAFKGLGLAAARANYTLRGLALQLAAVSKQALATGLPKRVPMVARVLAGDLAVDFSFKAKGGEAVALNLSLPLSSLSPARGSTCSLGLSAAGALSLSCPLFSLPLGLKAIDTGVANATASLSVTLAAAPRAKVGAGTAGAGNIGGAPVPPVAANDTAAWDTSLSPPACKAFALANDVLPSVLSVRVLMACNNKTVEVDNPVINLEAGRSAEAGCEFADGSSVAWTNDYQGADDVLRNGSLFVQQYYFAYYPPPGASNFTASFTYTLQGGGAAATATVSCAVPPAA